MSPLLRFVATQAQNSAVDPLGLRQATCLLKILRLAAMKSADGTLLVFPHSLGPKRVLRFSNQSLQTGHW